MIIMKAEDAQQRLRELRPHPIDEKYQRPAQGGCWICRRGNGWEEGSDTFNFATEIDSFYHPECLEKLGIEDEKELIMLVKEINKN